MKKQKTYNTLNRPTHGWMQNNTVDYLRLVSYVIYGEQATTPNVNNLLGKLWQQYNESGKVESIAFDFKGNLLSKHQGVISSTVLKTALDSYQTYLVDWTGLPSILGTQIFETSSEFDALNSATKITLPEDVNTDRKEIIPTYNRAGALEKVSYDSTEYVENIAYNAKGQRLLIAFGNNIMTRYAYDNRTFRLLRQRSEKYVKTQTGNIISYTPQSGTNKQDDKYVYDLIGNIFNINIRTTACGVGGTDSLDRAFDYDPLYRVISGTGRENVQGGNYPFPAWDDTTRSTDPNTTQAYTRKYQYDKLGNVQQVKQLGTSGFTRDFSYISGKNKLEEVEIGLNSYNFTYDACGNQLTENTTRQFEWDAANRLILFKNQIGSAEPSVIAQYLYDSAGNRVKKIVRKQGGDYEIRTYIDGIFEHYTDETDEQNTVHIMDDQSRVATVRIGYAMGDVTLAIKYNLENNIYSSAVTLDDNGTIVNTQEYYPFGETSFGSYGKKRYRYSGKEKDQESGLYYYGARYYMAYACRFISVDPLADDYMHLTPYNYAGNKPITHKDLEGLQGTGDSKQKGSSISETSTIEKGKQNKIYGLKITGTKRLKHKFEKMLEKRTGNKYEIDEEGFLNNSGGYSNIKTTKKISGELSHLIEDVINSSELIEVKLVNKKNDVFIDDFKSAKVDVADLKALGKTSKALQAAFIGHFLTERLYSNNDYSKPEDRTDENYDGAHKVALYAEARIFSAMEFGKANPDISITKPVIKEKTIYGEDEQGAYSKQVPDKYFETWDYGDKTKYGVSRSYIRISDYEIKPGGTILSIYKYKN